MNKMEQSTIQQARMLSAEMIQMANSGHPGLPLGAAPMAYALFHNIMKYDPTHPDWVDRDRFVISAGHGSALLYSMLYLYGYEVDMGDLKNFRQLGSRTPGHPEYWCVPGVETSTGPLGAGFSNAVGMAMAERRLNSIFGDEVVDHHTYVLVSDGDLEEGLSAEVSSFAGNQKLDKLVCLYDSNGISIEGNIADTFSENITMRFNAVGWHVETVDGSDPALITAAVEKAKIDGNGKPKLIICETVIGQDAGDKAGTAATHGSPLGEEILSEMRELYGYSQPFEINPQVTAHIKARLESTRPAFKTWDNGFFQWKKANPEKADLYKLMMSRLSDEIDYPKWEVGTSEASRKSSNKVLNAIAAKTPSFIGGSADLAPSTATWLHDFPAISHEIPDGRNIHFGIREHAMGGIINGMALHGGVIPFGATFLVFSDYMRAPIRLSALIKSKSLWIFTHDSFWVGEDGPTHQPVEQIDALRLIPDLKVIRPADGDETVAAYKFALKHNGPTCLIFSRQGLKQLENSSRETKDLTGYVVHSDPDPQMQIFASGSEVDLSIEAAKIAKEKNGINFEVISVPLLSLADPGNLINFTRKKGITARVAIEAGTTRVFGCFGIVDRIGLNKFGESGPGSRVAEHLNFTPASVAARLNEIFASQNS
jgi:transketolase